MARVKIDLNDLTQAHLDECRPHLADGRYCAPCIVGTLIPKEMREDPDFPQHAGINGIRITHFLELVPEQVNDLALIQDAFDSGDWFALMEIASKYVKEPVA